jgi:hypothetical protein
MDDIQRPSSLVAGIACAKHLYAPWHGNRCPIEKVLNFPETSMSIQVNYCNEKVIKYPLTSMRLQVGNGVHCFGGPP